MKRLILAVLITGAFACSSKGSGNISSNTDAEAQASAPSLNVVTFNADSAYRHVEAQVNFGPRIPGTSAHAACVDYITKKLHSYGADTVAVQRLTADNHRGGTTPVANILARYNSGAKRRVLLLAHYDSRPWADNDDDEANHSKPVPGANDGASGVGVLLELARCLGEKAPAIGVDLLMVDAEDAGDNDVEESWCIGTQEWLKAKPYKSTTRPAYAILLDMVGGTDAVFYREYMSDRFARSVNDRIWTVAAASGFADRFNDSQGGAVTDDHIFVNRAGIPAVDIIDAAHPATGSFPPTWHTVADDLKSISSATLNAVGQTVANVIYSEKAE
jgi:hypothetical protein